MNPFLIKQLFKILVANPKLVGKFLEYAGGYMPNIQMPTLGGHVFWENLAEYKGWRLQKNSIFGNCRILNPDDERVAWGSEAAMRQLIERFLGK